MTSDKEFNKAALTAVICAFIIMTFVLLWRSGVDIRWADVLINLCIALLTAIISIFAAFALYKRGKKAEQKRVFANFKLLFAAFVSETNDNLGILVSYQKSVTTDSISHFKMLTEVISKIVTNHLIYKHLSEEHVVAIRYALHKYLELNSYLEILMPIFYEGKITEHLVKQLQLDAKKVRYYALVLQNLNQVALNVLDVRWVPSTDTKLLYMDLLKNEPKEDDLEKFIDKLKSHIEIEKILALNKKRFLKRTI